MDGAAGRRRGIHVKKESSYWAAIVHRVSGIALALFLPLHFWTLSRALELDAFLAWTREPLVKLAEWGIVLALAAHLAGGLRVLALELLPWTARQRTLSAAAAGLALAVGLAFALALQ
jgi:fumarate reductase subunit D